MDTIVTRGAALHTSVGETLEALGRAAATARLKNDPLAEQLRALEMTMRALLEIYEASEGTQRDISASLTLQAAQVADDAIAKVHASGVSIIDQLAPRLAALVETTVRKQVWTIKLRTILGGAAAFIAVLLVAAMVTYGIGFNAGRAQGVLAARAVNAAMAASPQTATMWGTLMADNDPVQAMAACRKSISEDASGRHYCPMPVWLDPPPAAGS